MRPRGSRLSRARDRLLVDMTRQVAESNETNNSGEVTVKVASCRCPVAEKKMPPSRRRAAALKRTREPVETLHIQQVQNLYFRAT